MSGMGHNAESSALRRARQLMELKRYQDALEHCLAALASNPDSVEASQLAGWASLELNQLRDAEGHLGRALQHDVEDPVTLMLHSHLWSCRGYPRLAEDWARKVLSVEPAHDGAWFQLASISAADENWRAAREYIDRACALAPEAAHFQHLAAVIDANLEEASKYAPDQQLVNLHKALEQDPASPEIHIAIAELYQDSFGDHQRAAEHFAIAVESDPMNVEAREGLLAALSRRNGWLQVLTFPLEISVWLRRLHCWIGPRTWLYLPVALLGLVLLGPAMGLLLFWAGVVWPLLICWNYFTLSDLKRRAGIPGISPGLLGVHHWPMGLRLAAFAVVIAGFWLLVYHFRGTLVVKLSAGLLLGLAFAELGGLPVKRMFRDAWVEFRDGLRQ